jgi:hypothetical protein
MEKAKAFILTAVVQLGYLAILVQAFVVTPALKSFRPCACTIIMPTPIKRLTLINQLPSSDTNTFADNGTDTAFGPKICGKNPLSTRAPPVLQTLKLEPYLENLVFDLSAKIDLCVKIDGDGKVARAEATSTELGDADEKLIEIFVVENWRFRAPTQEHQKNLEGDYAFKLGVHEELHW